MKKTAFKFNHTRTFIRLAILSLGLFALILTLTGCDTLRTIGQGINTATDRAGRGALCVMVGNYPCIIGAGISGYAEGKEQTRDKIRLEKQADKGVAVDSCWFWCG